MEGLRWRNWKNLSDSFLIKVYDPCMGSGSLLLNAKKYAAEPGYIRGFVQGRGGSEHSQMQSMFA